jgi:hypothetical protein
MKPLSTLSILLTLLLALGCSKDDEAAAQEGGETGDEPPTPPAESTEPTESGSTTNAPTTTTNAPTTTTNAPTTTTNTTLNLPVGKQRQWTYATGQQADLDRAYLNQPINILTNAFGMPSGTQASGQPGVGVWFYDKMKVDYQGTIYTKINVIVRQGQVIRITFDPRSEDMGGDDIDPATGSPIE